MWQLTWDDIADCRPCIFSIIIWSLCNGIGTPIVAALLAVRELIPKRVILRIVHCHIWEIDEEANRRSKAVLANHLLPGTVTYHGDLKTFPSVAAQQSFDPLTLHLVLTGTPCQAISRAAKMAVHRNRFGLHASPSNLWHVAYEGICVLKDMVKLQQLIVFSENVIPAHGDDLKELDAQAGFRSTMFPTQQEGNSRPRLVWTSVPLPVMEIPQRVFGLQDTPRLRACFPRLFWQFASQEPMSAQDRATVLACVDRTKQPMGLPEIDKWATCVGMDRCTIAALKSAAPCLGTVTVAPPSTFAGKHKCGSLTYCDPCCHTIAALGAGWNLQTTKRYLVTLLKVFLYFRDFHDDHVAAVFHTASFPYDQQPHKCGDSCSLARAKFQ